MSEVCCFTFLLSVDLATHDACAVSQRPRSSLFGTLSFRRAFESISSRARRARRPSILRGDRAMEGNARTRNGERLSRRAMQFVFSFCILFILKCKARRVSNRSISMSNSGPPISVRSVPDGDDLGATAIIDRYFTCLRGSPKRSLKRGRSESWGQGEGASKAPKTESSY